MFNTDASAPPIQLNYRIPYAIQGPLYVVIDMGTKSVDFVHVEGNNGNVVMRDGTILDIFPVLLLLFFQRVPDAKHILLRGFPTNLPGFPHGNRVRSAPLARRRTDRFNPYALPVDLQQDVRPGFGAFDSVPGASE